MEELQAQLEAERTRNAELIKENAKHKQDIEIMKKQFEAWELEEEHITNVLLKRLEEKKREKEQLLVQVEQEEEYLTNTLQQKLNQLRMEKVEIENRLEQEEEFLTNKLQKQIDELVVEKEHLARKVEELTSQSHIKQSQRELAEYREKFQRFQTDYNNYKTANHRLRLQVKKLKADNFVLAQKVQNHQQKLDEMKQQNFLLESDMELKSECEFNLKSRKKKRGRSMSLQVSSKHDREDGDLDEFSDSDSDTTDSYHEHNPRASKGIPIAGSGSGRTNPISIGGGGSSYGASFMNRRTTNTSDPVVGSFEFGISPSPRSASFFSKSSFPTAGGFLMGQSPPTMAMSAGSPANSFLNPSFMESFLSRQKSDTSSARSCVKRGWLKTYQPGGSWALTMFVVFDNGDLVCCSSETGVTVKINLDTVEEIRDCSKQQQSIGRVFPNYAFELKTKFCSYFISCETEKDYQDWTNLLRDLSPLCQK